MDRRFPEWKEKEANYKLIILTCHAIIVGVMLGVIQSMTIRAIPKDIGLIWQMIISIVVGLTGGCVAFIILDKYFKNKIGRAIRPLIWDLEILHGMTKRHIKNKLSQNDCSDGFCTSLDEIEKMVDENTETDYEYIGEHEKVNTDDETNKD